MSNIYLSDVEIELIRFLAGHFREKGRFRYVKHSDFPNHEKLGEHGAENIVQRFKEFGWVDTIVAGIIQVCPCILDIAHEIDNPPPKDYWKSVVRWFRSRWWSVPVVLLLVTIPLCVEWSRMLLTVLRWMGIIE